MICLCGSYFPRFEFALNSICCDHLPLDFPILPSLIPAFLNAPQFLQFQITLDHSRRPRFVRNARRESDAKALCINCFPFALRPAKTKRHVHRLPNGDARNTTCFFVQTDPYFRDTLAVMAVPIPKFAFCCKIERVHHSSGLRRSDGILRFAAEHSIKMPNRFSWVDACLACITHHMAGLR